MSEAKVRIHKLWPTVSAGVGLVLVFFGERVFASTESARFGLDVIGAAAVLAAVLGRVFEERARPADDRRVSRLLTLSTAGVAVALAIYALGAALGPDASPRTAGSLAVLWPLLLIASAFPLAAVELAVLPVAFAPRYEDRRVRRAFERGLSLALLLGVVGFANFLAKQHEVKRDFSLGDKTKPSDGTRRVVRDLSKTIKVTLFFPKGNEVAESLQHYFDLLAPDAKSVELERVDQALAGKRATETGVSENGYVAVSHENAHEKIRLGLELGASRASLRKFDSDFAKAIIKVTRGKSVAYFTVGHGERSIQPDSNDTRPPLTLLKRELQANQYDVKPLGVAEGLANELPKDASIVFVMGPEKPFLPEEIAALKAGLKSGARLLVALEVEREGHPMPELLQDLGLRFEKQRLANDDAFVRVTQTEADRAFIFSNRYSSHASVTTMSRNASKLATLFAQTGYLVKADEVPGAYKTELVLRAMPDTYADLNQNLAFDAATEKKDGYGLAAAVTKAGEGGAEETRVFVVSDVDVFTDTYVRFQGNPYFFADVVYWLRDIKDPVLPTVSEEDVRIVHKRSEDTLWFYVSIFGAPLLVGGIGAFVVRRKKRRG